MEELFSAWKPESEPLQVENLRPVYKLLLPRIRIETLGTFRILSNNKVLDAKSFEGARPVQLLKAIVLHGSKDIPKEILIDDLWPDSSAKAGNKNFKINLHRLRKAMEPDPNKEFGYSYIFQKSGLISLDPELVTLDVDEFMAFGTSAFENEKNNNFERAVELYEKAVEIYKGNYFAEEPYLEWISRKRDLFKARFVDILKKKARLHEEVDQIEKAVETWHLVLDIDPYFETAYQNLMILYADSGRKNSAIDIFFRCRSLLKKDLGTKPDQQTFDIYRKIKPE